MPVFRKPAQRGNEVDTMTQPELVEQSAQVVQNGRLALLVGRDPEPLSALLGDIAIAMMEFGADVIRIDALTANGPADIVSALCEYLGVSGQDLMTGLRIRGETGNAVCLVIDNGECLEGKALDVLRNLLEGTSGGVGVLLGGEPDLALYIEDAAIKPMLESDIDGLGLVAADEEPVAAPGLMAQLPWRHLAAAAGLGLLVWLFWPGKQTSAPDVRELNLPPVPGETATADDQPPAPEKDPLAKVHMEQETPYQPLDDHARPVDPEPAAAPTPEPVSKPAPAPAPEPKPEPKPAPKPTPKPTPKPAPKPKPAPVEQPAAKPAPPPALSGLSAELGYHQEEWLLTQPGSHWMLQVALATSEDSARQLLDQIGRSKSAYYRAERNGRHVYIVLAGPWSSRDAALAGKGSLPASLQSLGPFPRDLAGIHKEIGVTP